MENNHKINAGIYSNNQILINNLREQNNVIYWTIFYDELPGKILTPMDAHQILNHFFKIGIDILLIDCQDINSFQTVSWGMFVTFRERYKKIILLNAGPSIRNPLKIVKNYQPSLAVKILAFKNFMNSELISSLIKRVN